MIEPSFSRFATRVALLIGLVLAGVFLTASLARAAGLTVTKTADTNDGVCDADCSLREALAAANAALDPDTIVVPAGVYSLSLGEVYISSPVTLTGALSTTTLLNAAPYHPVIVISSTGAAVIANVTLQNGNSFYAGGLINWGALTLSDSQLTHNTGVVGGGLYLYRGPVLIRRSWIVDNTAGITGLGGGLYYSNDLGGLTIEDSLIAGNTSAEGGGLYTYGSLAITGTTFRDNVSYREGGGGLVLNQVDARWPITGVITSSLFVGNRTAGVGGGIRNYGGTLRITDSEFLHNVAGSGGAIASFGPVTLTGSTLADSLGSGLSGCSADIENSTIYGTRLVPAAVLAWGGGAGLDLWCGGPTTLNTLNNVTIAGNAGTGIRQAGASVSVSNSLLAGNTAGDCWGTLSSLDYNLIQTLAGCTLSGAAAHTLSGQDPRLAPPQRNGGRTLTLPLLTDSPAVDAGNPAALGSPGACAAVDQRGVARPAGAACDLGASEGAYPASSLVMARAAAPESVALGQAFTETVVVTNTSVGLVTGLRLTDTWPASVALSSPSASLGSCGVNGSAVSCGPAALAAGAAFTLSVVVTPTEVETLVSDMTATADTASPGAVNLRQVAETVVTLLAEQTGTVWPALSDGGAAWGDYDGDGRLDVVVFGNTGADRITRVYHNLGAGGFALAAALTGVSSGSVAWGDDNNDGRLDLLVTGFDGSQAITRLYRGDGQGGFIEIPAGLIGVQRGAGVWGDYDGDGRADLLITGLSASGPVTKLYRNSGGGGFVDVNAGFPGLQDSAAAWGDYNNDGRPDLALIGNPGSQRFAQIYRNEGNGFTGFGLALAWSGFAGLRTGAAAWGDYDGDGWLDLVLTGDDGCCAWGGAFGSAYVVHNDGAEHWSVDYLTLTSDRMGAAWGDYDNDGRPDLALANAYGPATLLHNEGRGAFADARADISAAFVALGDYNADGRLDVLAVTTDTLNLYRRPTTLYANTVPARNTPPSAPTGLTAVISGTTATLSWNAVSDGQTPAAGLSYNVRVGFTSGGVDVVSPLADPVTGQRFVPGLGNAGQTLSTTVTGLAAGVTYYWSVQAIDAGWLGSAFAAGGSFDLSETGAPIATPTATAMPSATPTTLPAATPSATATPPLRVYLPLVGH